MTIFYKKSREKNQQVSAEDPQGKNQLVVQLLTELGEVLPSGEQLQESVNSIEGGILC